MLLGAREVEPREAPFGARFGRPSSKPFPVFGLPAITDAEIVGPALEGEELFHATALSPVTGATIRRLALLEPRTLALMHGSSTQTRCGESLRMLADAYDRMTRQL